MPQNTPPERTAVSPSTAPRLVAKTPPAPEPTTPPAGDALPDSPLDSFDDLAEALGAGRRPEGGDPGGRYHRQRLTIPLSRLKAVFTRYTAKADAEAAALRGLARELAGELAALKAEKAQAAAEAPLAAAVDAPVSGSNGLLSRLLSGRG